MYGSFSAKVMIVVEDDNELLFNSFEDFVQQHVNRTLRILGQLRRSFLEVRKHGLAKAGYNLLNSKRQITEEYKWIGIRMVQLIPNVVPLVGAQEVSDKRRLSGAGVGGYQCYRMCQIC